MKQGWIPILLALITSLSVRDVVTCVHFYWNQADIAATHCVNKTRPELECNGKCYLKKVLESHPSEEPLPTTPASVVLAWARSEAVPMAATPLFFLAALPPTLYHPVALPPPKTTVEYFA